MSNRIMRALCWTMAVVFPMALIAADTNAAMLTGAGAFKVNGTTVNHPLPVHAGDRIATESNGSVNLLAKGISITLPADSSVIYGGSTLELGVGRVLVNSTAASGMTARLAKLTIAPSGKHARFQMTNIKGKLALAALEGALRVSDGANTIILPSGQMMTSIATENISVGSTPDTETSVVGKRGIPGWAIGVITAGAIGGIVTGVAVTRGSGSTSPSTL